MFGSSRRRVHASASMVAPAVSNEVAGTHEGQPNQQVNGEPAMSLIMNWTPGSPKTFAISCGSLTDATVPCRIATRANSQGGSMLLSTWTCASTNPGTKTPGCTGAVVGTQEMIRPDRTVTAHGRIVPASTSATRWLMVMSGIARSVARQKCP